MSEATDSALQTGGLSRRTRIFIAGHLGMVGSAIHRRLKADGFSKLVVRSRRELDLTDQQAVRGFFTQNRLDCVILAAAKVGGIQANNRYPADFIHQNLVIETNVIYEAHRAGVERLLFLGSSCIYPRNAPQPMPEEALLSGLLEPTNAPYAVAKIAGITLCESFNRQFGTDYRALMPTNLYGPNDNFDLQDSHVLPALIRKFHLAKLAAAADRKAIARDAAVFGPISDDIRKGLQMTPAAAAKSAAAREPTVRLWGSGRPRREFLHVDDLAAACILVLGLPPVHYRRLCRRAPRRKAVDAPDATQGALPAADVSHLNVGVGEDLRIRELAEIVRDAVGYTGKTVWDSSKPDGTPRKLLDVSRLMSTGWRPRIGLKEGIGSTYQWYLEKSAAEDG